MKLSPISIRKHDHLVQRLDERLRLIRTKYENQMRCGQGCARCCHGLFDISVFDALRIASGFRTLPKPIRYSVAQSAAAIQTRLKEECPGLEPSFFLDSLSQDRIDELVGTLGEVRCPLLDARNSCLLYQYRPVTCRLEGLPMLDTLDGLFGDWCELNFQEGLSAEMRRDFEFDYYEIQAVEQDAAIFIPSVVSAVASGGRLLTGND